MTSKPLFSIPVYERPDLLKEQIDNLNYFCEKPLICIHISSDATETRREFKKLCGDANVIFNPVAYETIPQKGIFHTHVSNFAYAIEQGLDFDRFVLTSPTELFVKKGLSGYIAKYEIGAQTEVYEAAEQWGPTNPSFLDHPSVKGFLADIELPFYFRSQPDGQFCGKKLFQKIAASFMKNFPMGPCGFPVEEIILPTFAGQRNFLGHDSGLPITLCNDHTNLVITREVIEKIQSEKGGLFGLRTPGHLHSPHLGASVLNTVFSVKRIAPDDDELRGFLRNQMTALPPAGAFPVKLGTGFTSENA